MIDLGLPSGTKWACCNVGATKPEEYGGYYAWGETEEKECYNPVTYLYSTGVDEDGDGWYNDYHGDTGIYGIWQNLGEISGTKYDVAHVKWGGKWCMPTHDQQMELLDNCSSVWTTENGARGRRFTGPSGGSIFFPAPGYRNHDCLVDTGGYGGYWSSTQSPNGPHGAYDIGFYSGLAYSLCFESGFAYWWGSDRDYGQSVRPVMK